MSEVLSSLPGRLKNHSLIRWIVSRPVLASYTLILTVGINIAYEIQPSVHMGEQQSQIIFSLIQLIALILPGFAILLHALLEFSGTSGVKLAKQGPNIRRWSAVIVGLGTLIMAVIVLILGRLLILPIMLEITIILMAIVIATFASVPLYLASMTWTEGYQELTSAFEQFQILVELESHLENPDENLQEFFDWYDLEPWIEPDQDSNDAEQTQISEF